VSPRPLRPAMQISLVIGLVLLLAGVGFFDRALPHTAAPAAVIRPVSAVAPADVESSAWYCAGGSGTAGSAAVATLNLLNTTGHGTTGSMTVVTDSGATRTTAVSVAAHADVAVAPSQVLSGTWVATSLQFNGGGVLVTQSVDGPDGWSSAPCAGTTSADWYFASGSTEPGHTVTLSLFNPTAATAVVDLSFLTPHGVEEPQLFEGVVVPADGLTVEQIGAYVQDQSSVSTVVHVRTGRVVADELETAAASGVSGVSLRLGEAQTARVWVLPRSVDPGGGTTTLSICNPTFLPVRVVVRVRLPSGPVAPFSETLLGQSTWVLDASAQTRIPTGVSYSTVVRSSGGGVVVDRGVATAASAPAPQFGAVSAVPADDVGSTQIVASPGAPGHLAVAGAAATGLGLFNLGSRPVSVTVSTAPTSGGAGEAIARVVVAPLSSALVGTTALAGVHRRPLVVRADGTVVAMIDLGPVGSPGVVTLPALPLEAG
jgi:hypothetical protein